MTVPHRLGSLEKSSKLEANGKLAFFDAFEAWADTEDEDSGEVIERLGEHPVVQVCDDTRRSPDRRHDGLTPVRREGREQVHFPDNPADNSSDRGVANDDEDRW